MTDRQVFSGGNLDRAHQLRRDEIELRRLFSHEECRVHLLWHGDVLILGDETSARAVTLDGVDVASWVEGAAPIFLGLDRSAPHFAIELSSRSHPLSSDAEGRPDVGVVGAIWTKLRSVAAILDGAEASRLAYARALTHWHRTHRFCGACGAKNLVEQGGHVLLCEACQQTTFPRTDAAVIVLVTQGDHALLGRQPSWSPGLHSVLAGFVEPGESLEEAVEREVFEEVGVPLRDVTYFASQPWPFPSSLMIGFRATALNREIIVDGLELESADWFTKAQVASGDDNLKIPPRASISRRLIDAWLAES